MSQGEGGTKASSRKGDQTTDIIDGKGRIDKVGNREGTSRSSLAAASALGHNSLSKPMSQGEGGTKASLRKRDQATDIIGPTENTNRGGMNAAEPSTQSAFTQKKDEAREKNIGDAQDNNTSRWGNSRRTRAGQITNYIHPGIIDKRSSLMGEGRGGPPRSSRIEAGNVVDCKSIMPTGQVEDLPLPGSPREENDDIILSRGSKSWLIEGVLVKSKVYLAGNFNVNVNLSNLTEEIESSGGIVIDAITGADIVVVGDQSKDEDVQSMPTNTSTPRIDLELLYKVMKLEVSLWDIAGTPSKVSCTEPNNQPSAYAVPGRQNCKMSHTSIPSPKRYPLSQIKYTGSLSVSPPSYLAISQRVLEQRRLMEKFDQANPCINAHQGMREALKSSLSVLPPSLQIQVARTSGGSGSGQSKSAITPDPLLAKIKTLAARRRPLSQLKYTRGGSQIIASPPAILSTSMPTTTNSLESPSRSPITVSPTTRPSTSSQTELTLAGSPIVPSVSPPSLTSQSAITPDPLLAKIKTLAARRRPLSQLKYTRGGSPIIASPPASPSESMQTTTNPLESPSRSPITVSLPTSPRMSRPTALTMSGSPISSNVLSLLLTNQSASIPIRERGSEQSDINRKGVPLKNPIFEHFKVVEKEELFFDTGASPKKVSFAREISVRLYFPSTQASMTCPPFPWRVSSPQTIYTRSASVRPSTSTPRTLNPSDSPSVSPVAASLSANTSTLELTTLSTTTSPSRRIVIASPSASQSTSKPTKRYLQSQRKHTIILTASKSTVPNSSENPGSSPSTSSLCASPSTSEPTTSTLSPSERSSESGKQITACSPAILSFSKPTTSNPLPKRYPLLQRKYTDGPRALPLSLTGQSASTQIHALLSKHTMQAKAKQLQDHQGGKCKPIPIPFETFIGSNGSDHKLLQQHFWHCGMQSPMQKKTRRGKRMSPCCCTGGRHSPNAPPDLDCEGFPWCTSNITDKSIKFTNFDANPLSYCVRLYRSTQTTSAINLLQPEEEQSTKEKRCNRWEELDSHNDGTSSSKNRKRDHSSMVATPILPNPKRLGAGMKGNIKRWTQQEITKYTGSEINKSSQRQKNKSKGKIIIYDTDITSRTSKRQRRNNK